MEALLILQSHLTDHIIEIIMVKNKDKIIIIDQMVTLEIIDQIQTILLIK